MASSSVPNDAVTTSDRAVSPPSTNHQITPAPVSPAPVQEKQTHSYYGPQPPHQPPPVNYFAQYPQSYGQPLQPYAAPAIIPPPPPGWQPGPQRTPRPEETKTLRWSLISLHASSFLFAIVDIALSLSLLKWGFGNDDFYGDLTAAAVYLIVAPVMAFIWSGAELITRLIRSNRVGITPGAHVGCCLIIWLACAIVGGLLAGIAPWYTQPFDDSWTGRSCYNTKTGIYERCDGPKPGPSGAATRRGIFYAIIAMAFLLWAVNFTLFVRACIDTHRRNVASRPIVYVPYWAGPATQGWQALPQQNDTGMPPARDSIPMQTRSPGGNQSPPEGGAVTSPPPARQVQEYYTPSTGVAR